MPEVIVKQHHRRKTNNHRWTEEERAIVRRDYQGTHASAAKIAANLGVTQCAVTGQIARLGISIRPDYRPWTKEEDAKLAELIQTYCPGRVAKIMNRSINGVTVRSKRLNISRRARNGWFTKTEVCEILGVDHKWIQNRIDSGALKASWHNPDMKPGKLGAACWEILEEDLRHYIRTYPQELTGRNIDVITVVDILCGVNGLSVQGKKD